MDFYKKVAHVYFILLLLDSTFSNLDVPKHFCGKRLSNFLGNNCKVHNSLTTNGKWRVRRSIVDECCKRPCSQKYLLCNYCAYSDEECETSTDNYIESIKHNERQPHKHPNEIVQDVSRKSPTNTVYSHFNNNNNAFPCRRHFQQHRRIRSFRDCRRRKF